MCSKKLICLIFLVLLLGLAGSAKSSETFADLWSGDAQFIVDADHDYFGLAFGMHFISTIWDNNTLYTYYIDYYDGKFAVGLATSPNGIAFTDHGTVVDVGSAGQWDDERASFPGVWKDGDDWYMVYEGYEGGGAPAAIGLATSPNGYSWTKDGNNPILQQSGTDFMDHEIGTPSLWKEGDTWYLFYHGYDMDDCQIGVATGEDLTDMTHYSTTTPRVSCSASGWDCGTTGKRSIMKEGDYYYMLYEGSTDSPYGSAQWSSGMARSTDLLTWTKFSNNPVIPQTLDCMGYDGPELVETPDGKLHDYYRGPLGPTSRATLTDVNTLLEDGFESNFDKWTDGGGTDWDRDNSQKHSGSYSAHCGRSDNDLISDNLDTNNYNCITIVFWYRDDDIDDSDDVYLQLRDEDENYDNKFELGTAPSEDKWRRYQATIYNTGGDAQYFHPTFRIKFEGTSVDWFENLWIDDVWITAAN